MAVQAEEKVAWKEVERTVAQEEKGQERKACLHKETQLVHPQSSC